MLTPKTLANLEKVADTIGDLGPGEHSFSLLADLSDIAPLTFYNLVNNKLEALNNELSACSLVAVWDRPRALSVAWVSREAPAPAPAAAELSSTAPDVQVQNDGAGETHYRVWHPAFGLDIQSFTAAEVARLLLTADYCGFDSVTVTEHYASDLLTGECPRRWSRLEFLTAHDDRQNFAAVAAAAARPQQPARTELGGKRSAYDGRKLTQTAYRVVLLFPRSGWKSEFVGTLPDCVSWCHNQDLDVPSYATVYRGAKHSGGLWATALRADDGALLVTITSTELA